MDKINQLMKSWQKGTVKLSSTLKEMGYQKDLLKKYVQSGWLESLGYGAFKLAEDNVEWYGALKALQEQKNSMLHPGGKTALILKGYGHYLSAALHQIDLFGNKTDVPPKWFKENDWQVAISFMETKLFNYSTEEFFSRIVTNSIEFKISSPELSAMEMLNLIPKGQSFDEALKIMEGLVTLRPQLIQSLLEQCNSIKVKRLFLFMAEKNDLPWISELNLRKIYLGSGKRSIIQDGVFNKKYNITVPREYAG